MERAVQDLAKQQAETLQTVRDLMDTQPGALAGAMREVLTDRDVLAKVGATSAEILRETAKNRTGGWLLSTLQRLFGGWILRIALVLLVLKLAGFDAAGKAWQALFGAKV